MTEPSAPAGTVVYCKGGNYKTMDILPSHQSEGDIYADLQKVSGQSQPNGLMSSFKGQKAIEDVKQKGFVCQTQVYLGS